MFSCEFPLWVHLATSAVGFVLGVIGAFVFVGAFYNWHAGFWSLIAGLYALVCLHLHTLEKYRTLDARHSVLGLKRMEKAAVVGVVLSGIAFVGYLTYCAFTGDFSIHPLGATKVLPAIQALLGLKWSFALKFAARKYRAKLQDGYDVMS